MMTAQGREPLADLLVRWEAEAARRRERELGTLKKPAEAEVRAALDRLHAEADDDQPQPAWRLA